MVKHYYGNVYNSVAWVGSEGRCLGSGRDFFFCKRGLPSPNISANHMARILSTSYVHVHVHTRTVNVCAMLMISYVILKYASYDWLKCNPRLQKKNRGRDGTRMFKGYANVSLYVPLGIVFLRDLNSERGAQAWGSGGGGGTLPHNPIVSPLRGIYLFVT